MIVDIERGSTKWHSVENSLWKRLWTCSKADCGMDELFASKSLEELELKVHKDKIVAS